MKRSFICLLFALLFSLSLFSQKNKIEIGVEAAPGLASIRGNKTIEDFHRPAFGLMGGISLNVFFGDNLSFRSGLAFERKGSFVKTRATDNFGNDLGKMEIRNRYSYMMLPILLRYYFGEKKKIYINAGPYLAYLLKQHSIFSGEAFSKYKEDRTTNFKKIDAGFSGGFGVAIPLSSNMSFTAEIRDNLGLTNVNDVGGGAIKHNSINLLLGVAYIIR